MRPITTFVAVFTLSLLPAAMRAQTPRDNASAPQQRFYRVHFAVAELDGAGKVTNTRNYDETIATAGGGQSVGDQQIKTGSRVPIATRVVRKQRESCESREYPVSVHRSRCESGCSRGHRAWGNAGVSPEGGGQQRGPPDGNRRSRRAGHSAKCLGFHGVGSHGQTDGCVLIRRSGQQGEDAGGGDGNAD